MYSWIESNDFVYVSATETYHLCLSILVLFSNQAFYNFWEVMIKAKNMCLLQKNFTEVLFLSIIQYWLPLVVLQPLVIHLSNFYNSSLGTWHHRCLENISAENQRNLLPLLAFVCLLKSSVDTQSHNHCKNKQNWFIKINAHSYFYENQNFVKIFLLSH